MLELLSLLRPLSTWQMLLWLCLLDLALIAVRLSSMLDEAAVSPQGELRGGHHLRQLLARQSELAQSLADGRRELEENRRQLQTLMAAQAARAELEAEQLRLLTQGVEDLERGVAALLLAKHAGGTRSRLNATQSQTVT